MTKYIKILFLFISLIGILLTVYKNPNLIFEEKTQLEILKLVEKVDENLKLDEKQIETLTQSGELNEIDLLKDLETSKSFEEQDIENQRILGEGIKDLLK